jgi:hypothetical protein
MGVSSPADRMLSFASPNPSPLGIDAATVVLLEERRNSSRPFVWSRIAMDRGIVPDVSSIFAEPMPLILCVSKTVTSRSYMTSMTSSCLVGVILNSGAPPLEGSFWAVHEIRRKRKRTKGRDIRRIINNPVVCFIGFICGPTLLANRMVRARPDRVSNFPNRHQKVVHAFVTLEALVRRVGKDRLPVPP